MYHPIFVHWRKHAWHGTRSVKFFMMLVKHEPLLTHKRHTTTGVQHRRAES